MSYSKVEILRAACCIAGHDGDISEHEAQMLNRLAHQTGVGAASLEAMKARGKSDPEFYREQFKIIGTDAEGSLRMLFAVAIANHDLTETEVRMLWHFARKLGMDEPRFRELYASARKHVKREPKA